VTYRIKALGNGWSSVFVAKFGQQRAKELIKWLNEKYPFARHIAYRDEQDDAKKPEEE
jgi:hypothetical protein